MWIGIDGILYGFQAINMLNFEVEVILDIKDDTTEASLHFRNIFWNQITNIFMQDLVFFADSSLHETYLSNWTTGQIFKVFTPYGYV